MALEARPRVLVADDHAPTRSVICRVLEDAGLTVCATAHDAEGAVDGARRTRPDVTLLDVRMPGDGIEAARVIRDEQPDTSIVMLTVSDQDEDLFAALSAGAAGYLLKGQDPATIPDALRMILAGEAVLPGGLVKRIVHEYRARDSRQSFRSRIPRGRASPRGNGRCSSCSTRASAPPRSAAAFSWPT